MINKIDKFFKKITFFERVVAAVLLFVLLLICLGAVIMRYAFNSPLVWSEEVTLVFLVGLSFLCISVDVYGDEHIALDFLYNRLPPSVQRVLDALRHILIGTFFLLMVKYGFQIYNIKANKRLAITGWSQGLVYIMQIALSILMVIFCVFNVIKVFYFKKPSEQDDNNEEAEA